MPRTLTSLAVIGVAATFALASGDTYDTGKWPKSWPQELEPLRNQYQTKTGGMAMLCRHEIRFHDPEQF